MEVYPNLINPLLDLRQSFEVKKDLESAAQTARLAAELYPQSDRTNVFYAISLILIGKKDDAGTVLQKAVALNSKGIASSGAMNQIALAIAAIDKLNVAIEWLEISTGLYPRDANLFGKLGDFYQKLGRQAEAVAAYQKALAIDPNFEKAKSALKKLTP